MSSAGANRPTTLLSPESLAALPQHLANHLQSWPGLSALPPDGALLYRSGALSRLQELEKEIVSWLQGMQFRAQQQKLAATTNEPPLTQQDAQLYATIHTLLTQVQQKYREVESVLAQSSAQGQGPANYLDDENNPGSSNHMQQEDNKRQVSNTDMTPADNPPLQQTTSHYQHVFAQQQPPQQSFLPPQQQPQQQQQPTQQSHLPEPSPPTSSPPRVAPISVGTAVTPSNPSTSTAASATSIMHWILPPDRRKLPGTRYQKIRTLRKTLFGKVVLYFDTQTQKRVAIKLSNKELLVEGKTTSGNQVAENPLEELRFLRILSRHNEADQLSGGGGHQQQFIHPGQNHVLQLLDECEDEKDLWTVLEFCGKGEFFDIVCAANRFDEPRAKMYFIQLAQGVAYLHAHLICHLDLSLENMLMDDQDVCKICDFGVARMMTLDHNRHLVAYPGIKKNKPGKIGYMAPEMFAGHSFYGHLCDVWAMGIILFISITGVPPYQLPAISDQRFKLIFEGNLSKLLAAWGMTNIMSPAAKDMISRCLCPPEKRLNIQQVLAHPFITGQT